VISSEFFSEPVLIASGKTRLAGVLQLPRNPRGMVLWARDTAARHRSPHADHLERELRRAGLAILLLDLLGLDERRAHALSIDVALLGTRLACAADWLAAEPDTNKLALGLLGAGRDAAAALHFAAQRPERVAAVVSRGGRPDLAGPDALARVRAPTLLVVGEEDRSVLELNRLALGQLNCEKDLAVIRDAGTHLDEPGCLQQVARLAARWFGGYVGGDTQPASPRATPPAR